MMITTDTAHDHLVCCFCDNEIAMDSRVCFTCHEYKGIMTVEAFEDYLKVSYDCDCRMGSDFEDFEILDGSDDA